MLFLLYHNSVPLKIVPFKMKSDFVNQLFKFCKIYHNFDKQFLITADAENAFPLQSTRRTKVSQFVFEIFGTE